MPLYEYHCQDCQHSVEVLIRFSEQQPTCPDCGGARLERLISLPAAPSVAGRALPVCETPMPTGGCGLPQCGMGRCAGQE